MVANGDRVSHVDGWSFHSDLPELTQDANMDSAQLLPAAVRAGHDLSSHGSRRSTNPFAAVIWQASSSTLALLSPTVISGIFGKFSKEMTTTMDHQQLKSCGLKEGPIYPAQWATLHTFRQVPSTQ